MTEKLTLPGGLEEYRQDIEKIISWMPTWLRADSFDNLAKKHRILCRIIRYSVDTYILTPFQGIQGQRIHLLRLMEQYSLIEKMVLKTDVFYRVKVPLSMPRIRVLKSALGLPKRKGWKPFRNHFVTHSGTADYAVCLALVREGLMQVKVSDDQMVFWATLEGAKAAGMTKKEFNQVGK